MKNQYWCKVKLKIMKYFLIILSLVFINTSCKRILLDKPFVDEIQQTGLVAIKNCPDLNKYYAAYYIDTIVNSKGCEEHYKNPGKVYLWNCEYVDQSYKAKESLSKQIGCWYYYVDGHLFQIHYH